MVVRADNFDGAGPPTRVRAVIVTIDGEVIGVVNNANNKGTRRAVGNFLASTKVGRCDLKEVAARTLVGIGVEFV